MCFSGNCKHEGCYGDCTLPYGTYDCPPDCQPDDNIIKVKQLEKEVEALKVENVRLSERDCNASVRLMYDDGNYPFTHADIKIVDIGVYDNVYMCESKTLDDMVKEVARLKIRVNELLDNADYPVDREEYEC